MNGTFDEVVIHIGNFGEEKSSEEELQEQIERLEARICQLEEENQKLKDENAKVNCARSAWADKAVEWQQKCEEHEKGLQDKPRDVRVNLNDRIKVKLTPLGADIFYHQYDEVNKAYDKTIIEPHLPKVDNLGYTTFQLHDFIRLYGEHIGIAKPNVIDPIEIIVID